MQKKLLAAAVGSALGAMVAPAAMAQNATVNVYGNLYGEYSVISNGAKTATELYQKVDTWQNPDSYIGFRGEEKLNGGMSVWFQCEITMDYRGSNNSPLSNAQGGSGLCTRTSALGLKNQYTNTFFGNWATPFNRAAGSGLYVGANSTGVFGISHLMFGGASTYGISSPANNFNNGTVGAGTGVLANTQTTATGAGAFARRQNNLLTIESNNIAGFQVMGAATVGNAMTGATLAQLRSRIYSLGARYENYGLGVGFGYEKHKNFYGATSATLCPTGLLSFAAQVPSVAGNTGCVGSDESAWSLQAQYTFPFRLKVGGAYTQQKATTSALTGVGAKVSAWNLGADWMFMGPHGVRVNYARANDIKADGAIPAVGGATIGVTTIRPGYAATGTGANMWQIRYVYQFSKRTEGTLGYSRTHNGINATYETGGASATQLAGTNSRAFAFGLKHAF